jgi:hypothetical protein
MSEIVDLSHEEDLLIPRTPQEILEDTAQNQVWERITDLNLSSLEQRFTWLVNSLGVQGAVAKAVAEAEEYADFEDILLDECPGIILFSETTVPFWDELAAIVASAVNSVWSQNEGQFPTLSESDRTNLEQKLHRSARNRLVSYFSVEKASVN